jgi:hypothetical protein
MFEEGLCTPDGVTLARSVRDLARRARRVLDRPLEDEAEARALFDAIEELERQLEPGTSEDIGRWLASLRRRIEARLPAAV